MSDSEEFDCLEVDEEHPSVSISPAHSTNGSVVGGYSLPASLMAAAAAAAQNNLAAGGLLNNLPQQQPANNVSNTNNNNNNNNAAITADNSSLIITIYLQLLQLLQLQQQQQQEQQLRQQQQQEQQQQQLKQEQQQQQPQPSPLVQSLIQQHQHQLSIQQQQQLLHQSTQHQLALQQSQQQQPQPQPQQPASIQQQPHNSTPHNNNNNNTNNHHHHHHNHHRHHHHLLGGHNQHSSIQTQQQMLAANGFNPLALVVGSGQQTEILTPTHLRKAKLMFFYVRYPNSSTLKECFRDVKFNKNNTAQLVKWFSNFREFYYIQMEKFAREAVADDRIQCKEDIVVNYDHELINQLNNHYNKNRHIELPEVFRQVVEETLRHFFDAIQNKRDQEQSWKKVIYKQIARLDQEVPEVFKTDAFNEHLE